MRQNSDDKLHMLRKSRNEALLMTAIFIVIGSLSFMVDYRLALCFIPLSIWTTYRFRMSGAITTILGTTLVTSIPTIFGRGPFATNLFFLVIFLVVLACVSLAFAKMSILPSVKGMQLNALLDQCIDQAVVKEAERFPQFTFVLTKKLDKSLHKALNSPEDLAQIFIHHFATAFSSMRQKKELRGAGSGYTPELDVRTGRYNESIEIIIRDNGLGITDEIAKNLFRSFRQSEERNGGRSCANAFAHDIITHIYHGTIRVESMDGEYFQLIITLPIEG